jgi:hypothetical protein
MVKFIISAGVQVRELFLPLQSPRDKKDKTKEQTFVLGQELAKRIRKGESWESLAAQHVPPQNSATGLKFTNSEGLRWS